MAWPLAAMAMAACLSLPVDDAIDWQRDLAAGEAQAKATGKPLLLVLRCER